MAAELPSPIIELRLGTTLKNTGTRGGQGKLIKYVPHEGATFGPGIRGMGMDFTASSRGGGSDNTKAGSGIVLDGNGLGRLDQITLSVWFKPIGRNGPARLLWLGPCWDLYVAGNRVGFKIRHKGRDVHPHIQAKDPSAIEGKWNFIAVTLDRNTGRGACYHALKDGDLRLVTSWENVPAFDNGEANLEIGNLGGIRPFKGYLDSVRIFDRVLSMEEIRKVIQSDRRPEPGLKDYVRNVPQRSGLFEFGDVCLSSRSKHKNSIETIRAFRPNRLLWCYTADKAFTEACRQAGIQTFQCAINSIPGKPFSKEMRGAAQVLDFDGKPVVAPWMVAFNKKNPWYWGCNNRPPFMDISVARAKKCIDAGADMIQFDDWYLVVSAAGWSASCFCPECMAAFPKDLKEHVPAEELAKLGIDHLETFNYRQYLVEKHGIRNAEEYKAKKRSLPTTKYFEAFQRRSVRAFFKELRKRINAYAGRVVPMSLNSSFAYPDQRHNFMPDLVDFLQGETWHMGLIDLAIAAKAGEGLGKWQVFVPKPLDVNEMRMAVAAAYALGQIMLVPWDMYMGSDETGVRPRYYGTVEEYGNLYHFVRDNPQLFNGCESPAMVGLIVNLDHYDKNRVADVCQRLLDAQVPFAFVPVGHAFYDASLTPERLRPFRMIITLNPKEQFEADDWTALEAVADDVPVLRDDQATPKDLESLSPFEVWGPKGVYIVPRVKRDAAHRTLICHVLNRTGIGGAEGLRSVSFLVRRKAFLGKALKSVRWHTPNRAAMDLEYEAFPNGIQVIMPRLPIWGIAELTFE
ncbi:MAG: LamG domain-containing protein [Planctomycetes bacterium]|nr:LamG domain-containing protein [Planctomycetota bacterium]